MYFHNLSVEERIACIQNIAARMYHSGVAPIKVSEIKPDEVETLLSVILDQESLEDMVSLYLGHRSSFTSYDEKIRQVIDQQLFPKYFGINHGLGNLLANGEVIHSISLLIESLSADAPDSSQMSPALFLPDYSLAIENISDLQNVLVAGVFSPVSLADWIQIRDLLFSQSNIFFVDIFGGIKEKIAQTYQAPFVRKDVLDLNAPFKFNAIFTNSLVQSLQAEGKYGEYEGTWDFYSLASQLNSRKIVFEKFYKLLERRGILVMIEKRIEEMGGVDDFELISLQLKNAGFNLVTVQTASQLQNRYWAEFCMKNSIVTDSQNVEGMWLIIAEKFM